MLMVTLEIAKQGNTCDPAYAEMEKYFAEKNITAISIDEMIAHWKALKRRDWALWLYKNKGVFEQLTQQQIPQVDIDRYAADYTYLEQEEVVGYVVNGITYSTLEEANIARQARLEELRPSLECLTTCNLEVVHANTDSTWTVINLDTFVPPENDTYRIQVLNPVNGGYTSCNSVDEAKQKRSEFVAMTADHSDGSTLIIEKREHPDFRDDV